jgi:anti-sigma-K factor RskA
MPLSDDQRALLRLLLAGDTYEQIAGVLGASPSEVRARANEAAGRMEQETLDGRSEEEVRDWLRELNGLSSTGTASSSPQQLSRRRGGVSPALWLTFAAGVVVLVVVLGLTQLGGDAGDEPPGAAPDQEDVVAVELMPVGRSQASGTAAIVRVADLPAVDLDVRGLTPAGPGETYVLWLLGSGGRGFPIAFREVGPDGRFIGRTEIPSAAAGLLPSLDQIDLSLVRSREAAAALNEAARSSTLPQHIGTSVLRGALRG